MKPQPEDVKSVFAEAIEKPVGWGRAEYLNRACGEDTALRAEVESLLRSFDETQGFLPSPDLDPAVTLDSAAPVEVPGTVVGRFKLLERIGEGGMATVYMAEQQEPIRRKVAFKIIKLGMDTEQVIARFEAERQALAVMDHPNIAKVLDAGATERGRPYFVMELVQGVSITEYCDQHNLSTEARLRLFIEVCHAVQHAHQKGIIHRDIKPSNVMVTGRDGTPVPKVIDFGIAKAMNQRLTERTLFTRYARIVGTPTYMSPEQAQGSDLDVDTRSDIYSLGVLLYELLTGTTPFSEEELRNAGYLEIQRVIRETEPAKPSTKLSALGETVTDVAMRRDSTPDVLARAIRGDLDWIVMKCLEKDRSRRYETANSLALDIAKHLRHEPVIARPPTVVYRLQKAWRRNRLTVAAGLAIGVCVLLALVVSTWSLVGERKARTSEQVQREIAETQGRIAMQKASEAAKQRQIAEANARRARRNLYAADMNLAHTAIRANNFGRADALLAKHIPQDGQEDLRHWEWRYMWQQVQGDELYALAAFDHHVSNIDHSPDGRHLAIGLYDGRMLIWDLVRNKQIASLGSETECFAACRYSPDGKTLIGINHFGQGTLRRWDTRSYEEQTPLRFPDPAKGGLRNLAISPDGRLVAAFAQWNAEGADTSQAAVITWDAGSGDVLWTQSAGWGLGHMGVVCFSADSTKLFVGTRKGQIQRYDSFTGETEADWPAYHRSGVTALVASADGKVLASGSGFRTGDIKLWDTDTGRLITTLAGHAGWITWLEFSRDGKTLYSASIDQTARIWDLRDDRCLSVLRGHRDELYCLSLSPDGSRLFTGSKDGSVYVWSTQPRQRQKQFVSRPLVIGQWPAYWSFSYSPNGQHLFVLTDSNEILELDPVSLEDRGTVHEFGTPFNVLFSSDSKRVFVGKYKLGTEVYDPATRKLEKVLEGVQPTHYLAKTDHLVSWRYGTEETVIWDTHDWTIVATHPFSKCFKTYRVFTSDGRLVALAPKFERTVSVLQNDNSAALKPITEFRAHRRGLNWMTFSPDDRLLATSSFSGSARLWERESWACLATLSGHTQGTSWVAFSADGRRIITASGGKDTIKLWDAVNHQEVLTLTADISLPGKVTLVGNGRTLAVGGRGKEGPLLCAWNAPSWDQIAAAEAKRRATTIPR
jgi:WD40 repeat protein